MALLEIERLSRSFGAQAVLDEVSFEVAAGECLVLLGQTGCGKSTLLAILAGLLPADKGNVRLAGKSITSPGLDRSIVFQNESLLPWMTARENVALAVDQAFPTEDRRNRAARVDAALRLVRLDNAADRRPSALSGGMRQRAAIARAFATEPAILLMDEPFSALDALTRAGLQQELARIHRETGCTIVMVTNDLDEALLLADRVAVLHNDGSLSDPIPAPPDAARDRSDDTYARLRAALGRDLARDGAIGDRFQRAGPAIGAALPQLELLGVTKRFSMDPGLPAAVEAVSFVVREGEFFSLLGHSGCGKSTILMMVAGLIRPSAGSIRIKGTTVAGPGPDRAMVFQSPALLPWLTVEANVRLGVDQTFGDQPRAARRRMVADALDLLGVSQFADRLPATLSAGARQRVGVARAFALRPQLLLLDEPFASLDSVTRLGLQNVLARLCRQTGTAAILVTHDIDEALTLSDRIAVMTDGPAATIGQVFEVTGADPRALRRQMIALLKETARTVRGNRQPMDAVC